MRGISVAFLSILQAAFINAYELPFKLPFGLDSIFGTTSGSPELFALHKDLVNFPSVTGSEHDVGVYLEEYLKSRNYTVERIPGKRSASMGRADLQWREHGRMFMLTSARIEILGITPWRGLCLT